MTNKTIKKSKNLRKKFINKIPEVEIINLEKHFLSLDERRTIKDYKLYTKDPNIEIFAAIFLSVETFLKTITSSKFSFALKYAIFLSYIPVFKYRTGTILKFQL